MALNTEERKLVETLKASGKSNSEVMRVVAKRRSGAVETLPDPTQPNAAARAGSVGVGAVKGAVEGAIGTARLLQRGGQEVLGALPGVNREDVLQNTGFPQLSGEQARQIDAVLKATNPDEKAGKVVGVIAEILAGGAPSASRFVGRQAGRIAEEVGELATRAGETVSDATRPVGGILQTGRELLERVPRFAGRVQEGVEEAATRAERIRSATPSVQNAIRSGLDDRFINTVEVADTPTRQAYKEMLDIAEDTKTKTLRPKEQPSIVAGRAVENQFDLIEKQRRAVGKQIEDATNALPNAKVNMRPSLGQLESTLRENGVVVRNGVLDISGSTLSKAQGARLQELYDTATRAGDVIDAKMVHGMDRLFSQLQREARFDQLDNIFLNVNGQDVNAFGLFRDIYRNQLDNLSPEIRQLNGQYRKLRQLVDDAESSIFKTPNFEAVRTTDPAEFAKINLRRLAGESQSSPAFQAVVEEMDALARELGYSGARADDLIFFAQELRKLYPETTPPTGFQGGIRAGISDIIETVSRVGAPNVKDQQKALRQLIEDALSTPQ